MPSVSAKCLFMIILPLLGLSNCSRAAPAVHSSCFDEYVSLVQVRSYSDELDLTVRNVFTKEDSLPRCRSLVDAIADVRVRELAPLQIAVRDAGKSNNYQLCISAVVAAAGLEDQLLVTTPVSGLDRTNAMLAMVSNRLQFDAANRVLVDGAAKAFRKQESLVIDGDRRCRVKYLGWKLAVPAAAGGHLSPEARP